MTTGSKQFSQKSDDSRKGNKMKYKVGDIIKQRTFLDTHRYVKVTAKHDNIKNSKAGFDGYVLGDKSETVWGYDYQILRVL
jgi:hypothetical protein